MPALRSMGHLLWQGFCAFLGSWHVFVSSISVPASYSSFVRSWALWEAGQPSRMRTGAVESFHPGWRRVLRMVETAPFMPARASFLPCVMFPPLSGRKLSYSADLCVGGQYPAKRSMFLCQCNTSLVDNIGIIFLPFVIMLKRRYCIDNLV